MEKPFKFQSQGYDLLYGQGLLNEYDEILLGKRRKFSSMYFNFSDSTNELMALSVIKYAIEHFLKWKPNEAYNMLTKKVLKQLHLSSLLTYIEFPIELNKTSDIWYVVHKIYPQHFPLSKRRLITTLMSRIVSGERNKIPSDYFFCEDGELRACVCLQYVLENFFVFRSIEDMYKFFADNKEVHKVLVQYRLRNVYSLFYDSPLEFLHIALPEDQKNEFLYQYYSFINKFNNVDKIISEETKEETDDEY